MLAKRARAAAPREAIYAKPSQGRRVRHATLRKPTSACTQNCEHGCATGHCNGADGSELDRVALAQSDILRVAKATAHRISEYWLGCQRDGNTYERRGPAGRLPIWTHTRRPCASLARGRDTACTGVDVSAGVWPSATTTSELTRGQLNNRHGIDKTVADLLDAATTTAEIVARGREAGMTIDS